MHSHLVEFGVSNWKSTTIEIGTSSVHLIKYEFHVIMCRHYPIGVLFDLYGSNKSLPWNITVRFEVK